MASNLDILKTTSLSSSTRSAVKRCVVAIGMLTLVGAVGCGSNTQRVQQLQNENDRLLSEYRAQRDQVTQLNERLATLQNRLAESEKLLARNSPLPSSRVSRLNPEQTNLPSLGPAKDRAPSSNGSMSGGSTSPGSMNAASNSDLFWRPMRRAAP